MRRGARPRIVFSPLHDSGANGIPLDISNCIPAMFLFHWKGLETALPQVTDQALLRIEVIRVFAMSDFDGFLE